MTSMKRESFTLAKLPKPIFLNMLSIADDEWRNERWTPEEQVAGLTTKLDENIFLPILWRAIDDDGKKMIADAKCVKWEGLKSTPMEFETPEDKLRVLICGQSELAGAILALLKTFKSSVPDEKKNEEKKSSEVGS